MSELLRFAGGYGVPRADASRGSVACCFDKGGAELEGVTGGQLRSVNRAVLISDSTEEMCVSVTAVAQCGNSVEEVDAAQQARALSPELSGHDPRRRRQPMGALVKLEELESQRSYGLDAPEQRCPRILDGDPPTPFMNNAS